MSNTIDIQRISNTFNTENRIMPTNNNAVTNAASNIMGNDDFLRLFLTSLQFQDPTSPMETTDMMNQMSQLALMEQVQNMTNAVDALVQTTQQSALQRGMEFVGRYIVGVDTEATGVSGRVDAVRLGSDRSTIFLVIGDRLVDSQFVTQVSDTEDGLNTSTGNA